MTVHRLFLPRFRFASLNAMLGRHWAVKAKLKKGDREVVAFYARLHGVPKSVGKRRVSLEVVLTGRQKPLDDDNAFKGCLDALVACGLLVDDSPKWCSLGGVSYSREGEPGTTVVLTELSEVDP